MSLIDERDYYEQVDRRIYAQELADWLPNRLFDVHTHAWLAEHVRSPISQQRVGLIFEAEAVPWDVLQEAYHLLFPDKQVDCLAFGMPLPNIDREANNAYIAAHVDGKHVFGLFIPGLDDSAETLERALIAGKFSGFKPYLAYITWKPLEDIRIRDFVREAMLEVAHDRSLPIMLHVPKNNRLASPENLADLEWISAHYPQARIILAHGGRAYSAGLIHPALDVVEHLPNMYFEFSNVQSSDVVHAILSRMPRDRVMYGSDIPVATVRGYMFMLNGQRVALTRKSFPWSVSAEPPNLLRCTFMGYEQLRAMKTACENLDWSVKDIQALFYDNARALLT